MSKSIGLPYMGSKRKLASQIVDKILEDNPNTKYVYDLFGGGGSISFEFLKRENVAQVIYNDANKSISTLLETIRDNGIGEEFYAWIDKETFGALRYDDNWYSGFVKSCWSFGNNQRSYLYGKYIRDYKKLFHEVVVDGIDSLKEMGCFIQKHVYDKTGLNKKISLTMPAETEYNRRKLNIGRQINAYQKKVGGIDICILKQLEHINNIENLRKIAYSEEVDVRRLDILNTDYLDVMINTPVNETIIYLDPPYENTFQYEKDVSHNELWDYIKQLPYKVYVSGYDSPLNEVESYNHYSQISHRGKNHVEEKLFCNNA